MVRAGSGSDIFYISEDTASIRIHMPGAVAKTKKATNILRPAIDVTFDKDAEFEVFSDSRRFVNDFFWSIQRDH